MTISLLELVSSFAQTGNRESSTAYFRTHVPWVAPLAYFNIVFKPAPLAVLEKASDGLNIPRVLVDFLATQNGAILFSGAISIYGVHAVGQSLNRTDPFNRLPFNIEVENADWQPSDSDRFLIFGGYGFDGSRLCVDRADLQILLFKRGEASLKDGAIRTWKSFDEWLLGELQRISTLFEFDGHPLTDESETLPGAGRRPC